MPPILLAIDPGRDKVGYALVDLPQRLQRGSPARVLRMGIVPASEVGALWTELHDPGMLTIAGGGTGSAAVVRQLQEAGATCEVVPEHFSTRRARVRYLQEHPPRGWRKLIPRVFLSPPGPVDHYAALIIAEDWLAARSEKSG